jgi:hypothetical protein
MASVILASKYTSPLSVGGFVFNPNTTYDNTVVDFSNPLIVAAIDRGDLTFNDGVNTVTSLDSDPGAKVAEENAIVAGAVDPNAPTTDSADQSNDQGVIPPGTQLPQ